MQLREMAASKIPGPPVLDVTERTILNYAQGSFALIEADASVLGPARRDIAVAAAVQAGIQDAFAVRRQLIAFKKVCLNVFGYAQLLEKDLQQLATFHYYQCAHDRGGILRHTEQYIHASRLLQQCRGSLSSVHDARQVTKMICSIPRHPNSPRLPQLEALLRQRGNPKTAVGRSIAAARTFLGQASGTVKSVAAAPAPEEEAKEKVPADCKVAVQ